MDKNEEDTEEDNNVGVPLILRNKRDAKPECCGEIFFIFILGAE